MTTFKVTSGETDFGFKLNAGDVINVFAGGLAIVTVVNNGALENISGIASGTTVSAGGNEVVFAGGTASGTTLAFDGAQTVRAGGVASATTVGSAGIETVFGSVIDTKVIDGGLMIVSAGGVTSRSVLS